VKLMTGNADMVHPEPPFKGQQQERPGSTDKMTPHPDHGEQSYRGNGKLNGRVALITGADSGIGRAVAIAFAREGADVLVSYLCEDQEAQETAHWVQQAARRALSIAGDVADPVHCRELVGKAVQTFGRLDILVNNAAFQATHESVEEITDEE
jgi:NAD(P)-dependent dehydrogenase (short-subunit alcohol dehydrogenase family)